METNTDLKATIGDLAGVTSDQVERLREDLRAGMPSRPLFGVLPLRRAIPQDVHSVMDYVGGLALGAGAIVAGSSAARTVGHSLCGAAVATSLMTDYRLSLKKVVPIEVHEALDYVIGFGAMLAPFAFGYHKKDKLAAWLHFAVGASVVFGSLFTDYRSSRGKSWSSGG